MILGKYSRLKKIFLGILAVLIITTAIMLIDSLRSTQTLENQAASPLAGQCLIADRFCEWDALPQNSGAIFHYQIIDTTTTDNIIAGEGDTTDNFVSFNPLANHAYKCVISAKNNCNVSSKNVESSITKCMAGEPTSSPITPNMVTSTPPSTPTTPKPVLESGAKTIKIVQTKPTPTTFATLSATISQKPSTFPSPTSVEISKTQIATPTLKPTSLPVVNQASPTTIPQTLPEAGISSFLPMIVLFGFGMIFIGFLL